MSRKRTLIRGTAILTITSFATRFMGFFYRIFLSHTFGEENMGLYQLVFPVYALGISLSCAGIELALSRCVAKENAAGHPQKTLGLLKTSLLFTFLVSCIIAIFIQQNAALISCSFLHDSRCEELLVLLSYAFPFASVHSCFCGYTLGLKQTRIPAISQLFEQAFRILSVFLLCYFQSRYHHTLSVAYAVAGLSAGEIASSLYCIYSVRHHNSTNHPETHLSFSVFRNCLQQLLGHALPLTASRVLLNILQSIEAVSIPVYLQHYGMTSSAALQTYGVLTGMALPCILFPSAITNAVSAMLLPAVAEIQEMNEQKNLHSLIIRITCSCIFLGCFCCLFLFLSGQWIGMFLFKSTLAGSFILALAWICPFLYTNTVLLSSINGLGKTTYSFIVNFLSLCIRIAGVYLLIPVFGIRGYLNGLLISQIFLFASCILKLATYTRKF